MILGLDLIDLARGWLDPCPLHEYGRGVCRCPAEDHRRVIRALVAELERRQGIEQDMEEVEFERDEAQHELIDAEDEIERLERLVDDLEAELAELRAS